MHLKIACNVVYNGVIEEESNHVEIMKPKKMITQKQRDHPLIKFRMGNKIKITKQLKKKQAKKERKKDKDKKIS